MTAITWLLALGVVLLALNLYVGVRTMTTSERINAAIERQGAAITNVASDLRELIDKVTTPGGLSEADAQAIADKLEASATALETAAAEYQSAGEQPPAPEGDAPLTKGSGLSNS